MNALPVVAPSLRVVRLFRLARVGRVARLTRGLRLLSVFSSINRGMEALGLNLGRRGFGYMVGLSLLAGRLDRRPHRRRCAALVGRRLLAGAR